MLIFPEINKFEQKSANRHKCALCKFVNVKEMYFDLLSSIVSSYHVRIAKFAIAIERLKSTFSKEFKFSR